MNFKHLRFIKRVGMITGLAILTSLKMFAQPNAVDLSFNPGTGFAGGGALFQINDLVLQTDGKIVVAGAFTSYDGHTISNIVRINADGSYDTSYHTGNGFDGTAVYDLAIQPDNKVLATGNFSTYNGELQYGLVRINTDGSFDTSFTQNSVVSGSTILLQSNGKIIADGNFRLNSDGSYDNSFATNSLVQVALTAEQPDGKFLLCGGYPQGMVARFHADGTPDLAFAPVSIDLPVTTVGVQPDGKIVIGGDFFNCGTTQRRHVARLNNDGSLDMSFTPPSTLTNRPTLALQTDGKVVIGQNMTLFRLLSGGAFDNTHFQTPSFDGKVRKILVQPDGKIIATGEFTNVNSLSRNRIVRFNGGDLSTSIKNEEKTNCFSVYPNPATKVIHIALNIPDNEINLTIYNPAGQVVKRVNGIEKQPIDISDIPNGNYFIKLDGLSGSYKFSIHH